MAASIIDFICRASDYACLSEQPAALRISIAELNGIFWRNVGYGIVVLIVCVVAFVGFASTPTSRSCW